MSASLVFATIDNIGVGRVGTLAVGGKTMHDVLVSLGFPGFKNVRGEWATDTVDIPTALVIAKGSVIDTQDMRVFRIADRFVTMCERAQAAGAHRVIIIV